MRTLKALTGTLVLATLAIALTSCSRGTAPLSFTMLVPAGTAAHATLQASDGSVIQTEAVAVGTQEVSFTDAPADSLVTISVYDPHGNASTEKDYYNLTTPSRRVAGHEVMLVQPPTASVTVTVTVNCPGTVSTVDIMASGNNGYNGLSCAGGTGSVAIGFDTSDLQPDGSISLVVEGFDASSNPVDSAVKLDQNVDNGTATIATSDWTGNAPVTDTSEMTFPAIGANESASMAFSVMGEHAGRQLNLQPTTPTAGTGTVGQTSLNVSTTATPASGVTFDVTDEFKRSTADGAAVWQSDSVRSRQVSSLPIHEIIDTTSDMWPTIADPRWVDNGGSPTIAYQSNAGTRAATFAYAWVESNDGAGSPTIYRSWIIYGAPNATNGTIQFPDMPSSLGAFVPGPVPTTSSSNFNTTVFGFTDFDPLVYGSGLFGYFGLFAPLNPALTFILPPPATYHAIQVNSTHVTTSAVRPVRRPQFELR